MALNNFQKWALAILLIVGIAVSVYILFGVASTPSDISSNSSINQTDLNVSSNGGSSFSFSSLLDLNLSKSQLKIIYWSSAALVFIIAVVFIIYFFSRGKKKKNKDFDVDLELPKKPVDLSNALKLWIDAFVVNTGIPVRLQLHIDSDNPPLMLMQGVYVRIMNELSFSNRETGDNYCIFEVLCNSGTRRGLNVICIKTDAGEDWITNNWNWRVREKMSLNRYKSDERNYPLNTPQSNQERLLNMQFEAMLSGDYTNEEIRMFETLRSQIATSQKSNGNSENSKNKNYDDDYQSNPYYLPDSVDEDARSDALSSIQDIKDQTREEQKE